MTDQQRLEELFLANHPCISISTIEEQQAIKLIGGIAVEASLDVSIWSSSQGIRDGLLNNGQPVPDTEHPAAALYYLRTRNKRGVAILLDLAGHLKDDKTLRLLRDLIEQFEQNGSHLVLIDGQTDLPLSIARLATPFDLSLPDEKEIEAVVKETLRQRNEIGQLRVDINRKGLDTIIRNLRGLSLRQAKQVILDAVCIDRIFDISDVNTVLAQKRKVLQDVGLLEYIESPVDINEIGGLNRLKAWLKQRECALSTDAIDFGIDPPRGVLMLGVQGAGKSLSAKAVATAWQRPLLRMDVGALYDKYIGESEKRLRDALKQAEMMAPIILWIDEIEKAFASAASQSSDGGLSKRMFGALLTWMQEHKAPVFLIATANDIEALPPELLRKGRFDEIFFIDLPALEARHAIFAIHLRKRHRDPKGFDLDTLAEASDGFSGAEIEQSIQSALHEAFAAKAELSTQHLLDALKSSPPLSVTMAEGVQALRQWSRGRCVSAD
ncbi:MAG TPA: AAA family ATPase [Tepidisphaeraceae bacterium]|jgi:SpoVK/Ycf46/Vps4 family AAA+-type ATPase